MALAFSGSRRPVVSTSSSSGVNHPLIKSRTLRINIFCSSLKPNSMAFLFPFEDFVELVYFLPMILYIASLMISVGSGIPVMMENPLMP